MTMMMMKDTHTRRRVIKQEEPPSPPPQPPPPPPPTYNNKTSTPRGSVVSPPLSSSSSSSPSHDDFSFTISIHPSSADLPAADGAKTKPSTPSFTAAADLSPADDIFLHGHLLPLRLLSHLPVSPRSSTNSVDGFTLPVIKNFKTPTTTPHLMPKRDTPPTNKDPKPKSPFSFFRFDKRKKEIPLNKKADRSKTDPTVVKGPTHLYSGKEEKDDDDKEKQWKKLKCDISQAVKRYVKMMKPLLPPFKSGGGGGGGGRRKVDVDRKAHSFSSGTIRVPRGSRSDNNIINKRSAAAFGGGGRGLGGGGGGEYSAPASTRTSPANSGLLVGPPRPPPPSESTMEELQAAIQAAIAHCKKSISVEGGDDQRKSNATVA